MKIYTKLVTDWDGNILEEESYEYDGPIAEMKGGSTGTQTTSMEPPAYLVPYLQNAANEAYAAFRPFSMAGGMPATPAAGQVPMPSSPTAPAMSPADLNAARVSRIGSVRIGAAGSSNGPSNQVAPQPQQPAYQPAVQPQILPMGGAPVTPAMTTVPAISDDRLAAFNMKRDIAGQSSPYIAQAGNYATSVLNSQAPTFAMPDLQAQLDTAYKNAVRGTNSAFASAGRFGSGLNEAARAEEFSRVAAPMMEQARQFNTSLGENARQFTMGQKMQAAGMLPGLQSASLADAVTRAGLREDIGAQLEEQKRNEALGRFEPIQQYAGLLSGLLSGAGGTTSTPMYRNRGAGALGGALGGAQLGTMLMPGIGTAVGAIGGGLLGMM